MAMFSRSSLGILLRTCSSLTTHSAPLIHTRMTAIVRKRAVSAAHASLLNRSVFTSVPQCDLMEFFDDPKNWGADEVRVGRAWKIEELRLKSNQDLHKLWYVLLKERNMLLTAEHFYEKEELECFPNPERLDKVRESMSNLEMVVKERNKAFYQLEVSEADDGIQPFRHERNEFGIKVDRPLEEHVEPETDENRYRPPQPYNNYDVGRFLKLKSEQERRARIRQQRREEREVVGLLRRFPELDDEVLKTKFPNVDLDRAKRQKGARANRLNQF